MSEPVNEVQPHDEMDGLLRRSMAGTVPTLRADFERGLMRELGQGPEVRKKYRRVLLGGYGVVSAVTCAVIMRGQGLEWGVIAGMLLLPVAMVAATTRARQALRANRAA